MRTPRRPQRRRSVGLVLDMALINHAALVRLAVLLLSLGAIALGLWMTMIGMPGRSFVGPLPPMQTSELLLQQALQRDVDQLAHQIGPRNAGYYDNLNTAKRFVVNEFTAMGYTVEQQTYQIQDQSFANIIVEKRGQTHADDVVIVGAHYDSAFTAPGANDNGTGVAAILELARLFKQRSGDRTLRLIAFTNEEPSFFKTPEMGSAVYARTVAEQGESVVAMLSLETMGYFTDQPNSQHYPFPVGLFYPHQGNFIAMVGNIRSGPLVRDVVATFRQHVQFPCQGAALPEWIPGIGWSDHQSFWDQNYAALMVTDTAPFRYPYYHTVDDVGENVDFERLARVVNGLVPVIDHLITAKQEKSAS